MFTAVHKQFIRSSARALASVTRCRRFESGASTREIRTRHEDKRHVFNIRTGTQGFERFPLFYLGL